MENIREVQAKLFEMGQELGLHIPKSKIHDNPYNTNPDGFTIKRMKHFATKKEMLGAQAIFINPLFYMMEKDKQRATLRIALVQWVTEVEGDRTW